MERVDLLVLAAAYERETLLGRLESDNPNIRASLAAKDLLGLGRKPAVHGPYAQVWAFVDALHTAAVEVQSSWACLRNVTTYMRRFPYRDTDITRSDHLQYHLENWTNEAYILDERFRLLCKCVERVQWNADVHDGVIAAARSAREHVSKGLAEARDIRSAHVHERRVVDPAVQLLRSTEAWVAGDETGWGAGHLENEYRATRKHVAGEIAKTNEVLRVVLEEGMGSLLNAILLSDQRVRLPLREFKSEVQHFDF